MAERGVVKMCWNKYMKEKHVFGLYSPFFVSLVAGNLDLENFRLCISQDYHFQHAFVQAYEKVEDYPEHDDNKKLIRHLKDYVYKKIDTYETVVQGWGTNLPVVSIPTLRTIKYTDFVITTASARVEGKRVPSKTNAMMIEYTDYVLATICGRVEGKRVASKTEVVAYTLATIAPFLRLYEHLCDTILQNNDLYRHNISPIYMEWLKYYGHSQEIKELAERNEQLLETLSVTLSEEEVQVIEKLYDKAMKLQLKFFASLLSSQPSVLLPLSRVLDYPNNYQLITIFSNFDLTCSVDNSSAVLLKLPISPSAFSKRSLRSINKSRKEQSLLKSSDRYQQFVDSITGVDPGEVFDYDGLKKAIEQVAELVKMENAEMELSGALRGISLHCIKQAGQHLDLHTGCTEFFQKIMNKGNPKIDVHIISNCCCGDLIRSIFPPDLIEPQNIHSNELAYRKSLITTGKIVKKVESPLEKLQTFLEILKGHKSSSTKGKHLKIYIGDAVGDLLCLVEADIGIVFDSRSSLMDLGKHFGVKFVPLLDGVVKNHMRIGHDWKSRCGILYTVKSWAEIQAFILGV